MTSALGPNDIDTSRLGGAFDDEYMDAAAAWIVRFCQQRGGNSWAPFTRQALEAFYNRHKRTREAWDFGGLWVARLILMSDGNAQVTLTPQFIAKCQRARR